MAGRHGGAARAAPLARVRGRGPGHPGPRHRRHLGHLHRGPRGAAGAVAVCRARSPGDDLEPLDQLRQDLAVGPGDPRLPPAVADHDRRRRLDLGAAEPHRRRRAGAGQRRPGHRQYLRGARRRAAAGAGHHRRGRSAQRRAGGGAGLRPVAGAATAATRASSAAGSSSTTCRSRWSGSCRRDFRLPTDFTEEAAEPTELWRALQIDEADAERGSHGYFGAAVLAPGQTAATATAELQSLTAR